VAKNHDELPIRQRRVVDERDHHFVQRRRRPAVLPVSIFLITTFRFPDCPYETDTFGFFRISGVSFAIIQNPLSRFGDTAANTGILVALGELAPTMPVATQTAFASLGGATWRIMLTPIDTFKTTLQVQGADALALLKNKVKVGGVKVLYGGAAANFAANWVGNYPWFVTFNYLQSTVPKYEGVKGLARNAVIGMCASFVSDCVSNSLRVVKTIKQTNVDANIGYMGAIQSVIKTDGIAGLFGRGLETQRGGGGESRGGRDRREDSREGREEREEGREDRQHFSRRVARVQRTHNGCVNVVTTSR
jgi:hypothetical protein